MELEEITLLLEDIVFQCQYDSERNDNQKSPKKILENLPIELNHCIMTFLYGEKSEKSENERNFDKVIESIPIIGDTIANQYISNNILVSSQEECNEEINHNEYIITYKNRCEIYPSWMRHCDDCGKYGFIKTVPVSLRSSWEMSDWKYTCFNGCSADFPCGCHIKKVYTHYGWVPKHTCSKHGTLYQPPCLWKGGPFYGFGCECEDVTPCLIKPLVEQESLGIPNWWIIN